MNQSMCCDECLAPLSDETLHSRVTETMFFPMADEDGIFIETPYELTFTFCSDECALLRMSTDDPREIK